MADAIRIPRRKKEGKFHPKEAPFPIPIQSITEKQSCSDRWYYYTGYFRDNCVVIEDLGDLTFLYKMVSCSAYLGIKQWSKIFHFVKQFKLATKHGKISVLSPCTGTQESIRKTQHYTIAKQRLVYDDRY